MRRTVQTRWTGNTTASPAPAAKGRLTRAALHYTIHGSRPSSRRGVAAHSPAGPMVRLPVGSGGRNRCEWVCARVKSQDSRADGRVLSRDSLSFPGARSHSPGGHVKRCSCWRRWAASLARGVHCCLSRRAQCALYCARRRGWSPACACCGEAARPGYLCMIWHRAGSPPCLGRGQRARGVAKLRPSPSRQCAARNRNSLPPRQRCASTPVRSGADWPAQ
jgi:hypothetical protein